MSYITKLCCHSPRDTEKKRRKFVRLALNLVYSRTRHILDVSLESDRRYTNLISVSVIQLSDDIYKIVNFFEETIRYMLMKFQNRNMTKPVVYEENIRNKNKMEKVNY